MSSLLAQKLIEFRVWLANGHAQIRDFGARLIALHELPIQRKLLDAMLRQALDGKPVRVIVLKGRKVGVSTLIQALFYFLTKHIEHTEALTIAHTAADTAKIFRISDLIRQKDPQPYGQKRPNGKRIDFPNMSLFSTATAGGRYIASGSTINFLHLSELAKWPGDKSEKIQDQLLSALNAVPDDPNTIVIIESTANMTDASGEFEKRVRRAESGQSEYALVFGSWLDDPRYRRKTEPLSDLDEMEQALRRDYAATDEQLAWRRWTIDTKCAGNVMLFRQEYPCSVSEAFQVATGRVYPMLSAEKHHRTLPIDPHVAKYRAVDWGGAHPFVCLWGMHFPGAPGFSIDKHACPEAWRQMGTYLRDTSGRPKKVGDDAPDALRYMVMCFGLTGHVHIYRELFMENSAYMGLSELDLAEQVKELSKGETYVASVADRSRPNSIVLFNQRGIPIGPNPALRTTDVGEIEDGIAQVTALMRASVLFRDPPQPPDPMEVAFREYMARKFDYGLSSELQLAFAQRSGTAVAHPWLGACG